MPRPKKQVGENDSSAEQGPPASDYFHEAATQIDAIAETGEKRGRLLWRALKESAETDLNGNYPPDVYDAGQIEKKDGLNTPIRTLLKMKVFLSVKDSYSYLGARPGVSDTLPVSFEAYQRSFKKRFKRKLGRDPYNYSDGKRPRYAVTYAELLHMEGVPGIKLVDELEKGLLRRLEGSDAAH